MDRKEAIEWLKTMKDTIELYNALNNSYTFDKYPQAIGMAIESLSDYDEMEKALGYWQEECSKIEKADSKNITESPNDVVETDDEVIEHDREWIIGCIKHDGFIKTDRFDKANQIILDALSLPIDITAEQWDMYVDEIRKIRESFITPQTDTDLISRAEAIEAIPDTRADMFENCRNCKLLDREQVIDILSALPSAEAEQVTSKLNSDLISRTELIEKIKPYVDNTCKFLKPKELIQYIKELPSVSAVSLAKAEEITNRIYNETLEKVSKECKECKERLRSVSAERNGKWIKWTEYVEDDLGTTTIPHWKCSMCDTEYDPYIAVRMNYCPNCGCRMENTK